MLASGWQTRSVSAEGLHFGLVWFFNHQYEKRPKHIHMSREEARE